LKGRAMQKAHCHRCNAETETIYRQLSSGHIGNCCGICGVCHVGNPYISKRKYAKLLEHKIILPALSELRGSPKRQGERHDNAIY
jgi:hypothetical protein